MNCKVPFESAFNLSIAKPFGHGIPERDYSMSEEVTSEGGAKLSLKDFSSAISKMKNSTIGPDVKKLNSKNKSPHMRLTSRGYKLRAWRRDKGDGRDLLLFCCKLLLPLLGTAGHVRA